MLRQIIAQVKGFKKKYIIVPFTIIFVLVVVLLFLYLSNTPTEDYVEEYREYYDLSARPLESYNVLSVIEKTPERKKVVLEIEEKITKKQCPSWDVCDPHRILEHILVQKWANPNYDVSQEGALKERIINLYNDFKREMSDPNKVLVGKDRHFLYMAKYANILDSKEKNFWLKKSIDSLYITKDAEILHVSVFRFALDICNIDDLENKAKALGVGKSKIDKVKKIICGNVEKFFPSGPFLDDKTKLKMVWLYIARKRFCRIPLTPRDNELIQSVIHKNYLRKIYVGEVEDTDYTGEVEKYYLVNSDKVFSCQK